MRNIRIRKPDETTEAGKHGADPFERTDTFDFDNGEILDMAQKLYEEKREEPSPSATLVTTDKIVDYF